MLEYSVENDSVYCFICFLFPNGPDQEFFDNAWINKDARVWHKMKSRGKNKSGRLSEHFSSSDHKIALKDYSSFMEKSCYIDVLLDPANREKCIKIQPKSKYNKLDLLTEILVH